MNLIDYDLIMSENYVAYVPFLHYAPLNSAEQSLENLQRAWKYWMDVSTFAPQHDRSVSEHPRSESHFRFARSNSNERGPQHYRTSTRVSSPGRYGNV